jgi:hypothetical protein
MMPVTPELSGWLGILQVTMVTKVNWRSRILSVLHTNAYRFPVAENTFYISYFADTLLFSFVSFPLKEESFQKHLES